MIQDRRFPSSPCKIFQFALVFLARSLVSTHFLIFSSCNSTNSASGLGSRCISSNNFFQRRIFLFSKTIMAVTTVSFTILLGWGSTSWKETYCWYKMEQTFRRANSSLLAATYCSNSAPLKTSTARFPQVEVRYSRTRVSLSILAIICRRSGAAIR